MGVRMEYLMLILCVTPLVTPITVSSNGHSPKVRMMGGMMMNTEKEFVPVEVEATTQSNYEKSRQVKINSTKLSINERYRRLIPYMTFYYANDLATPGRASNVEVEKAEIIEAKRIEENQRHPKKIVYSQRNIPRYQGNRLTQYNIASANPTKIYYKDGIAYYQNPNKVTPNVNPLLADAQQYEFGRFTRPKPHGGFISSTRKPFLNFYNEDIPNIRYYLSEKEPQPKYKLVPYEQTPPVKVNSYEQAPVNLNTYQLPPAKINSYQQKPIKVKVYNQPPVKISSYEQSSPFEHVQTKGSSYEQPQIKVMSYEQPPPVKAPTFEPISNPKPSNDENYEVRKPVLLSVLVPKELYVKPRPVQPSFIYESDVQRPRKQPSIVSENYYEKQEHLVSEPVIESGFKPIAPPIGHYTTETPIHKTTPEEKPVTLYDIENSKEKLDTPESSPTPESDVKPNYYQYVVEQPKLKPTAQTLSYTPSLATLLNSLQINKSIPKPITTDNVGSSIKTLLEVLNTLKSKQQQSSEPIISSPKPFVGQKVLVKIPKNPAVLVAEVEPGLQDESILAEVNPPSQHLDEHSSLGGTSQQFPLQLHSDDEGGTPGRPGVDYPVLTTIPQTSFDCKTQRYKGFFADTETRCQVWHYCDLNGGQASFLCPNGTIFSQAGLTCDWWFNVKCSSTPQLYVLNESLYKFILPHSPKFPEDYSGPLVDKYLTLKFKEMEEEFKKNKNRTAADDANEEEESKEEVDDDKRETNGEHDKRQLHELSEASVIVESPGTSGKVERLLDE